MSIPNRNWSYNEPDYDDSVCAYCGVKLDDAPNTDSWSFNGYCDATCAGYDLIKHATWQDDHIHATQRREMMAAFGNLARFAKSQQGLERNLALTQVTGELPNGNV